VEKDTKVKIFKMQ